MGVLELRYDKVTKSTPYHAAYQVFKRGILDGYLLHTHDYWEIFYVLDGTGYHRFEDENHQLLQGDLWLVRPKDVHGFELIPNRELHLINIAFPDKTWQSFIQLTALEPILSVWRLGDPPHVHLLQHRQDACQSIFREALRDYIENVSVMALTRFLSQVLTYLIPEVGYQHKPTQEPAWLRFVCERMVEAENLRQGVPRMLELSGVSAPHLSRSFRQHLQQTPTEFVNHLRLEQAAMRLAATQQSILDISWDCGFENLSYFYRLFKRAYGFSPKAYREHAQKGFF
jgi:AraC-like DNA-binding protein/mannose-6-phosphate isomerase-like protein (cupin superfamily)